MIVAAHQQVHEQVGKHVRQVATGRQDMVVFLGGYLAYLRPRRLPQRAYLPQRLGVGFGRWRQNHASPAKQIRLRGLDTGLLGAGDGMSRNKMREARTERRARRRHDIALGAAGVGDDAVERKTAELGENARHGADRHCQYDDVGPPCRCGQCHLSMVDHAQLHGALKHGRTPAVADDFAHLPGGAQRASERAADKADADDAKFVNHGVNTLPARTPGAASDAISASTATARPWGRNRAT